MHKLIFRAASLLAGMVGGLLAGTIFKKAWQLATREDEAPKATDAARGWHEILIAAVLSGAGVQRLLRRPRRPSGLEDGPHVEGPGRQTGLITARHGGTRTVRCPGFSPRRASAP